MDQKQIKQAMQQAQNMQEGLIKIQEELSTRVIETSSDDGLVDIQMTAQGDFKGLKINSQLVAIKFPNTNLACPALESAILNAIRKGTEQATELTKSKLKIISDSMGLEQ